MKKILPILMTAALVAPLAAPRDSQAGLLVSVFTPAKDAGAATMIGAGAGLAAAAIWGTTVSAYEDKESAIIFGVFIGLPCLAVGALLDAPITSSEGLAESFSRAYPGIESTEAVSLIAQAAHEKIAAGIQADPSATSVRASFSESELADLLSGTSISAEQFRLLADELK